MKTWSLVAEFIGTFFFLAVILKRGEPIPIAVGLLAAIYLAGSVSGGHFNPAVSFLVHLKDKSFGIDDLGYYVVAQLAGAYTALQFAKQTS